MSTLITDGKFSNIELSKQSDLLYIDTTPLLKSLGNGQYRLNINSGNILGGTDGMSSEVFMRPFEFSKKMSSTRFNQLQEMYYGDVNGDSSVDAIDACTLLKINKSIDSINSILPDFRPLAMPVSSGSTPTMSDVLYVLKVSAGIQAKEVFSS